MEGTLTCCEEEYTHCDHFGCNLLTVYFYQSFSLRIIASERIKAYRKDVLVKSGKVVGGGDQTRKKKLLEKQKKGKKRQQVEGKVALSQEAFNSVISRSS